MISNTFPILIFSFVINLPWEIEGLQNKTLSHTELIQFCESKDPKEKRGYRHPNYCSKYIFCEYQKPLDRRGGATREIKYEEQACPKCDTESKNKGTAIGCPFGYEHWDEVKQTCRTANHVNCSQEKLPKVQSWGRTDLASFCGAINKTTGYKPHPHYCTKFLYCEWDPLYQDLYVETRNCPVCPKDPIKCPEGYEHHVSGGNCALPDTIKQGGDKCQQKLLRAAAPVGTVGIVPLTLNLTLPTIGSNLTALVGGDTESGDRIPLLNPLQVTDFCLSKGKPTSRDYLHPTDTSCTRYITCWFQQNFFGEKSCDPCDPGSECPSGFLHFDERTQECQSASNSSCIPEITLTTTTTAPAPTPATPMTPEGLNGTQTAITYFKNGTKPKSNLTLKFKTTGSILLKPKSCNPRNYVQRGYCKTYFKCDRKKRFEEMRRCSGRLFWNPDRNSIHGGVCDYLRNIDNYTLFQYKKDPECVLNVSYFRADDAPCSGTYFYNHPTRTGGKELQLHCPEDLLWSTERKSCAKCQDVTNKPGGAPCCDGGKGRDDYDGDSEEGVGESGSFSAFTSGLHID